LAESPYLALTEFGKVSPEEIEVFEASKKIYAERRDDLVKISLNDLKHRLEKCTEELVS
jgi:hypothetical protein